MRGRIRIYEDPCHEIYRLNRKLMWSGEPNLTMHTINLSGSHDEMGRRQGALFKGRFSPPPASDKKIGFTSLCIPYYEEYTPGMIEEIDGLSEEAEIDPTLMRSFVLTLGLEPRCTVFALASDKTAEGIPVFARNYDWDPEFQRYFLVVKTYLRKGLANLTFTDHPIGRYGGVNEAGLATAITAIPAYQGTPSPGIRMNIAVRWIMDHFESADEAAEWLVKIPHQWAHNFLLADRYGRLARVETSPERSIAEYSDTFIATTNHYHNPEMKKHEDPNVHWLSTHHRYNNVETWYREKRHKITIAEIKDLLSSHENGVCSHSEREGDRSETIWSWIAPLGKRLAYVCAGSPCKNDYQKIEF